MTKRILQSVLFLLCVQMAHASTWFVRTDGGTRYSTNVTAGQCNGTADTAYPGSGVNQNCAFNDVRYLWSDNSTQPAWVIAGGDTVVIRGCHALASQANPANPYCRLGYDSATSGNAPNLWCGYGNPNTTCFNPPIPAGTSGAHTKILGGCAYGTYTCTPINNNYPYGVTNETQLFGGFGLTWTFNLKSTSYVDIEGIELTTHNGVCTSAGSPSSPRGCSSSVPYDDFAANGFYFNTSSANILLQDVYIHGFNSSGMYGPFGGAITLTRVFSGFNAFAGWNMDDGSGTPDATGSTLNLSYVTMDFNGCYEEYPIADTYPARVCYDTNSGGFGDSLSGQGVGTESVLSGSTIDHYVAMFNTKDGFIGPHIAIPTLTITNSFWYGNMGSNLKWGGEDAYPSTVTFDNNLVVGNCARMEQPITGAPSNYNQYLGNFCRGGAANMASEMPTGSTWNITNNTFINPNEISFYVACTETNATCPATFNMTNNLILGYTDPSFPMSGNIRPPATYYFCDYSGNTCNNGGAGSAPNITLNVSHNSEFGMRSTTGTCPTSSFGMICVDPLLKNEPGQTWVNEAALDVFNPFVLGNSFYPTSGSPLNGAGAVVSGLSTDYYGVARPNPPSVGGVEYVGVAPPTNLGTTSTTGTRSGTGTSRQ